MKDVYGIKSYIKNGTDKHPLKITDDEVTITFRGSWRKKIHITRGRICILWLHAIMIPFLDKVILHNVKIFKNTYGCYHFVGSEGWNLCKMGDLAKALETCLPNYLDKRGTI